MPRKGKSFKNLHNKKKNNIILVLASLIDNDYKKSRNYRKWIKNMKNQLRN